MQSGRMKLKRVFNLKLKTDLTLKLTQKDTILTKLHIKKINEPCTLYKVETCIN